MIVSYLAVYGWNGTSYTPYNLTDEAGFWVAPGQGFWVAAASTSPASLNFTAGMRTTTGSGDFVLGPQPLSYDRLKPIMNRRKRQEQISTLKMVFT